MTGRPIASAALPDAQVIRPEVRPPLTDQVGLVDSEESGSHSGDFVQHLTVGQLLGREEDIVRPLGQSLECFPVLASTGRRIDGHRLAAALEGRHLITLQGDQGRDDQRRSLQQVAGEGVDG
jgi:hypothetical protein